MGLKSKKSRLSDFHSLSNSSSSGTFEVVSRRDYNPSASTLSLPSTSSKSRDKGKGKEKEKSITRISTFFAGSKKEKAAVPSSTSSSSPPMELKTDLAIVTMPSLPSSSPSESPVATNSHSVSSRTNSFRRNSLSNTRRRSRSASSVDNPAFSSDPRRHPLFVANPDPVPAVPELPAMVKARSSPSSGGNDSSKFQTSYSEKSDRTLLKGPPLRKEKDPLMLTYDPSTSTQLTVAASSGTLIEAVPLSYLDEEPPAYSAHPQAQAQTNGRGSSSAAPSSSGASSGEVPVSGNSYLNSSEPVPAARPRPKKRITKPAPLRHISVPAIPTQDRPELPARAVSVTDAEAIVQGADMGQKLDAIDELDESNPFGINLHVGGPFDAARSVAGRGVPSQAQPKHRFLEPVASVQYNPFNIPKGGLQIGQVLPRNAPPTSQPSQSRRPQKRASYTNHHLLPLGAAPPTPLSPLPSPGWPLPSPGFPADSGPSFTSNISQPVVANKASKQSAKSTSSAPPPAAPTRHMSEASSSSALSNGSSFHTAPLHEKPPSHLRDASYTSLASSINSKTRSKPSPTQYPASPIIDAYGGIEDEQNVDVPYSQIGLALGSPAVQSPTNGGGRTRVGEMRRVNEREGSGGGTEGIGLAILIDDSDDEGSYTYSATAAAAVPIQSQRTKETADARQGINGKGSDGNTLGQTREVKDEDYDYWTGDNDRWDWSQMSGSDHQGHSPYSLLDDKDAVEKFGYFGRSHGTDKGKSRRPSEASATNGRPVNPKIRTASLVPEIPSQQSPQSHLRHPNGYPAVPQQQQRSQTMYVPGHQPPLMTQHSYSTQSSPITSPYHSNSHSPSHSPIPPSQPPHPHYRDTSQYVATTPKKHHSLPSPASPDWVPRETGTNSSQSRVPSGYYMNGSHPVPYANGYPSNSPQNGHVYHRTNGMNGAGDRPSNGPPPTSNGYPSNGYSPHQRGPTSSSIRSSPLPPGAAAPDPYSSMPPPPPPVPTLPSQNPHYLGNRPRHAPTQLVMPAPLQGQVPGPSSGRPSANGYSPSQKFPYPPPPPIPSMPMVNGSAGKVLKKRASMSTTGYPAKSSAQVGGDEWGYMSKVGGGGYVSEGAVPTRSKTLDVKKPPRRVLSKRRADM
ncbi:hypothetical protein PQX77_016482 [Marasmius sp. AFHP31]|nr:hypothetical protein PQX77_016482 [Marasmius sp. AFHP31]